MKSIPSADFNTFELPTTILSATLYRSFTLSRGRTSDDILYFGKFGTERFDDPEKNYGVCYFGTTYRGCFIETFGQSRIRVVDKNVLGLRGVAKVEAKALHLVDITAEGAYQIGAAGDVWSGERTGAQLWSKAIFCHPQRVDGLLYSAKHDSSQQSVAVYDRASHKLSLGSVIDWSHCSELSEILERYRVAFIES